MRVRGLGKGFRPHHCFSERNSGWFDVSLFVTSFCLKKKNSLYTQCQSLLSSAFGRIGSVPHAGIILFFTGAAVSRQHVCVYFLDSRHTELGDVSEFSQGVEVHALRAPFVAPAWCPGGQPPGSPVPERPSSPDPCGLRYALDAQSATSASRSC